MSKKSKKRYMVVARSKSASINGLDTSRGHRDFSNSSALYVTEESEAKEIDQKFGRSGTMDAYVVEDHQYENALRGEQWDVKEGKVHTVHHYTFGPTSAFADAWEAFERRRNSKKRRRAAEEAEVENVEKASGVQESPVEHCEEAGDQQEECGGDPGKCNPEGEREGEEEKP